tara:strand:- start:528 stop:2003 length:1476 start_codon:yes stop_codon:yes gene_type:complete
MKNRISLAPCYAYEKTLSDDYKKNNGAIYTPPDIVGHINRTILESWRKSHTRIPRVADFSCGTGCFLVDMTNQISALWGVSTDQAMKNIYGGDIDESAIAVAQRLLPEATILCQDGFEFDLSQIDIVVGNPPYIRIQNLDEQTRKRVSSFKWCEGDYDIYVAFLEKAIKEVGYVGFICPSGWLKNKSNNKMREDILTERRLFELIDFGDKKVFDGVGAYTTILFLDDNKNNKFRLRQGSVSDIGETKKYSLIDETSFYSSSKNDSFLTAIAERNTRFYDVCDIRVGLATLADGVYYLPDCSIEGNEVRSSRSLDFIELGATRPCKKAGSIGKLNQNKVNRIIYPYDDDGKLIPLSTFKETFPMAYGHLLLHKVRLMERDKGKVDPLQWHQYGRTQGLKNNTKKMLLPPLLKYPFVYEDTESHYISGYAVFVKEEYVDYFPEVKKELLSDEFRTWIQIKGRPMSGGWRGINKQTFNDYRIEIPDSSVDPSML